MTINHKKYLPLLAALWLLGSTTTQAQSSLWGMTANGGAYSSGGTIFRTDVNGNNYVLDYSVEHIIGSRPRYSKLCQASNGKLYGLTQEGGSGNVGVLYEYDPTTNIYTKKIDFVGSNGSQPFGSLIQASNGKLYGMTFFGGTSNQGILFEYDIATNTLTKKVDFMGSSNGARPVSDLIQASNGLIYGVTEQGGSSNVGVIFEYSPGATSVSVRIMLNSSIGSSPAGSLVQASNGKLYGTTRSGGAGSAGVLFELDLPTNTYTKKVDFTGANGRFPRGQMIELDGNLHGMTESGSGGLVDGVIYSYTPGATSVAIRHIFSSATTGASPYGSLELASNGKLYGMTAAGGTSNTGVLFEFDNTSGVYTVKHHFSGATGHSPWGTLKMASDGKMYGVTNQGGVTNNGVLFEYDFNSNTQTVKHSFNYAPLGGLPQSSFVKGDDGYLYGTMSDGGISNNGAIFRYDPINHSYTKMIDFTGTSGTAPGRLPKTTPIKASNGKFYGLTQYGGTNDLGVLYEYDASTNTYTKKADFSTATGGNPVGTLVQAGNGKLYSTTYIGASAGIFEYDIATNTLVSKIVMVGVNGEQSQSGLMMASNGKLYGTGSAGGTSSSGVLFEYVPSTNTYTKRVDFTGSANGSQPIGSLMQASNGKIYGTTSTGGTSNLGTLFEFDPATNILTKRVDFTGTANGNNPQGQLMQSSNGKLYGMTTSGGTNNNGVLFEFDPATNTYTKKMDFNYLVNSSIPVHTALLEVCITPAPTGAASQAFCNAGTVANLVATGTAIKWYDAPTGGNLLAPATALVNGATYYASQTIQCESTPRLAVNVVINSTAAPTGNANQGVCGSGTVANLVATGNMIQWYDAPTGGNLLTLSTPLVNGANYYASQTMNGCESTTRLQVTVTIGTGLSGLTVVKTNNLCNGTCTGTATINVGTGTAPYSYAWSNGQTTQTSTGMCYGAYNVTVTDANGCTAKKGSIFIGQPSRINVTPTITNACSGGGSISVAVSGGTGTKTFLWSTGATTSSLSGLEGGYYGLTVTDANGCQRTFNYLVDDECVVVNIMPTDIQTCTQTCTGQADVIVSGGSGDFSFAWSNGATGVTTTGLCAGTHYLTVTDNITTLVKVNSFNILFSGLTATATTTPTSCNGACDGTATVVASGAQTPYTYAWNSNAGGQTTPTATGLCLGAYNVTVTSANGCSTVKKFINVSQPPAIQVAIGTVPSGCMNDGMASATVTGGGVAPYSFSWSNSETTNSIMNLAPGSYYVTVSDASGCFTVKTANIADTCQAKPTENNDLLAEEMLMQTETPTDGNTDINETLRLNDVALVDAFNVYPNPNDGQFFVEIALVTETTDARLRIHDVLGRTLLEQNLQGQFFKVPIDANTWTSGAYFVQLISPQGQTTRKVLITNE